MKPYALVKLTWRTIPRYPSGPRLGTTGYREKRGPDDLFSVSIVLLDGSPGPDAEQHAEIFALVESMQDRLPEPGERFIITSGPTPIAEALTVARGHKLP